MTVRSLAALLILFVVGCASEKALDHGCANTVSRANAVRVTAAVFDKAVYDAASQAELIAKFRNHEVAPLWSHIVTPDGGAVSATHEARVFSGLASRSGVLSRGNPDADSVTRKTFTSRDVGEKIKIGECNGDMLSVECEFAFVEEARSDQDVDIVHSSKVMGTVPVGAGDSVIGSVRANASGSCVIVIFVNQ